MLAAGTVLRNVCMVAFGHTIPLLGLSSISHHHKQVTFCFLRWHSVQLVLNFNLPSMNFDGFCCFDELATCILSDTWLWNHVRQIGDGPVIPNKASGQLRGYMFSLEIKRGCVGFLGIELLEELQPFGRCPVAVFLIGRNWTLFRFNRATA